MSFPKNMGQIPIYYAHKNTGRPLEKGKWFQKFRSNYLDVDNEPLFPFGYGLSYTSFEYGPVQLSTEKLSGSGTLTASVTLKNTGEYDGKEIVQLYVRDLVGSVTRPVKELKGFQKLLLKAGESTTVSFTLSPSDLGFYDAEGNYLIEPGDFQLFIGPSSETQNAATFTLE
jgi:beta-glucosidase